MAKNTEIERKFLVRSTAFLSESTAKHEIVQGYLNKAAGCVIRVRICDNQAFLTIKSNKLRQGIARFEWEKEIDVEDAREMLMLCQPGIIEKTRYIVGRWEVDVFHGRLDGRMLAEIELSDEQEYFTRPDWLGKEVTGQPEYNNVNM